MTGAHRRPGRFDPRPSWRGWIHAGTFPLAIVLAIILLVVAGGGGATAAAAAIFAVAPVLLLVINPTAIA